MKTTKKIILLLALCLCKILIIAIEGPTQAELNDGWKQGQNWLTVTHDYSGARYVPLDEINTSNVKNLKLISTFFSTEGSPSQTNPLVYNGVIYFTTAHLVYAIDGQSGKQIWSYRWRGSNKEIYGANRGGAIKDGLFVRGTPDGVLIALDMGTGTLRWSKQIAFYEKGEFLSGPPLIIDDKIIIGPAGSEWASKGWMGAFSLKDGSEIWRFWIVPQPGEPGAETWGPDPEVLKNGGGSVWTPLSYDPKSGLVFIPGGNPAPDFYDQLRPGDNLYTNSLIALDVKTGKRIWHYQALPHDTHDWDLTQVSPLFNAEIDGKMRNLVAVTGKDGMLHVLDRDERKLMYKVPFTRRENADNPLPVGKEVHVFPGIAGGQLWNGPAFYHKTNMLYIGSVEQGTTYFKFADRPIPDAPKKYLGGRYQMDPPSTAKGTLSAFDASTGKKMWTYNSRQPWKAAVTTTAGDLVLSAESDGIFVALDAQSGKVLYRYDVLAPMGGGIISYQVNGKQYIAVVAGQISGSPSRNRNERPKIMIFSL